MRLELSVISNHFIVLSSVSSVNSRDQEMATVHGERLAMEDFCTSFVFPNFGDQARLMQYAVLFLFTAEDLHNLRNFRCLPNLGRLTNCNSAYFPLYGYVNYVVANYNEERDFHAEETLCNRFKYVINGFKAKNKVKPEAMLLYTYYFPCTDCASLILAKLNTGAPLYLGYSEYSRRWTDLPSVIAMFDHTFVHMFQVHNAFHSPPEGSSSSEDSSSSEEEEESPDEDSDDYDYNWW